MIAVTSGYLNEYHLRFLRLLTDRGCRFLIIGGQARAVQDGTPTRDLDVWIDISTANRPSIDQALFTWACQNPKHSCPNFSQLPLPLRPYVQIKFPEAEAAFVEADGEPKSIVPCDGIDVYTSIKSFSFDDFYRRAHWREIAGLKLPFLAPVDIATTRKPALPSASDAMDREDRAYQLIGC